MTICVCNNLDYIQNELSKRGYKIINENSSEPCDAIICNLKYGGIASLNIQSSVRREGTLIIDSGSKTIDEIEYILNNRVYSSLF